MKKTVAVFFGITDPQQYLESKTDYHQAYLELSTEIANLNAQMVMVSTQDTHQGNGVFSESWQYRDGKIVKSGEIQATAVFAKHHFESDGIPVFNNPLIDEVCTNKWKTYQTFSEYCPATFLVENIDQISNSLDQISTELVVCKPIDGAEGKNVLIVPKDQLQTEGLQFPVLIQEFLDSSGGVPEIVDGLHDFRVAIIDGEIIYSYYRTPPTGSYLANVARGGRFEMVPVEKVPQPALQMVEVIEKYMSQVPHRFYGIDMAFTPQGIKIIEMNSKLGLLPNRDSHEFVTVKKKLAEILVSY